MPQRRKPDHLRTLHGQQPRAGRAKRAGGVDRYDADPPTWLAREGKAEWRRLLKATAAYPTWLQEVDRGGLACYCALWAELVEAATDVAKRGSLVPGRSSADQARGGDGGEAILVKNPSVQVMRDAQAALRAWSKELGFTPDARSKVERGSIERVGDDLERLLSAERHFTPGPFD